MVTELSKYVKSKLGGLDNQAIFPSFLWVVRDFSLDLQITPKNYLEFALSSEERYTETERNKQQIKASLKQYFRDRDCFTLVRPIHDEKKLQNASKLESYEIRPEFRNQIEKLKQKILDTVAPKELGGRMLNGRMFISLCENYCNAINDGSIIVDSCWSNVVKTECDAVHSESIKIYKTKMQKLLRQNVDQTELENIHFESESEAVSYFLENSKLVVRDVQFHVGQLHDSIVQIFKIVREEVRSINYEYNSKILSSSFSQISTSGSFRNIEEMNLKFRDCLDSYNEKAKGDKNTLLADLMTNWIYETMPHYHNNFIESLIMEKNKENEQIIKNYEERLQSLQEQMNFEIVQLSDSKSKMKDQMLNLSNAIKKLKKDLTSQETLTKEQSDKIVVYKQENSKLMQDVQHLRNDLENSFQELKEQKDKFGDQLHTERLENDALKEENTNLQRTIAILQENKSELQRNIGELQEVIAKLKDNYNKVRLQNSNTEETLKQTTEVLESSTERKRQLEDSMKKLQEQVSFLNTETESQKETIRKLEREISTKNAKIKSSERMMMLEKEKAADSEDRLRQTLKNSAQLSSSERIKELEEQVEHLNTTNRRILEINKTVMEENKSLKDKVREKKIESRTSTIDSFKSTPEKLTICTSNPSTPNIETNTNTPLLSSGSSVIKDKVQPVQPPTTSQQTKTPDMEKKAYETPRSISDISPISVFNPNADSDDSVDTSTSSNDPAAEKIEGKKIRKTVKRRNSPIKQTRTPVATSENLSDSANMRRLTRRQSFGGSPKKIIDTD